MRLSVGLVTLALAGSSLALPAQRRDAVQDFGNALKAGSDTIGLTEAHNLLDAATGGAIKAFENDSGLTEASEGVGIQPYGLPITKRQTLSGGASANIAGSLGDFNSLANTIQAQFDALVAQLTGEFSQFTGTGAAGASLPDASSLIASFQAAAAKAQALEAKFQDLENQVEAAFQSLASAANVNLPAVPSLSGGVSGSGIGSVSTGGDDASNVSASTSNTGAAVSST